MVLHPNETLRSVARELALAGATVKWPHFNNFTYIKCLALSNRRTKIIVDILKGLQYIHDSGIVHGDLHVGNIFLDKKAEELLDAVIGDFGLSGSEPRFENRESSTQSTGRIWRADMNSSRFKTSRSRHRSFLPSKSHSVWYALLWRGLFSHSISTGAQFRRPARQSDRVVSLLSSSGRCWAH